MVKILIIDDDLRLREDMGMILDLEGFQVITTGDGYEGISLAATQLPDLIICDVNMPILDGYGVYRRLQESDKTRAITFLFLTGEQPEEFQKHLTLDSNRVLAKPFYVGDLLERVNTLLRLTVGRA